MTFQQSINNEFVFQFMIWHPTNFITLFTAYLNFIHFVKSGGPFVQKHEQLAALLSQHLAT